MSSGRETGVDGADGRTKRRRGRKVAIVDGPYTETKELIGAAWPVTEAGIETGRIGVLRTTDRVE